MSKFRVTLRVDFDADNAIGPGKIALLEKMRDCGSLSGRGFRGAAKARARCPIHAPATTRNWMQWLSQQRCGNHGPPALRG